MTANGLEDLILSISSTVYGGGPIDKARVLVQKLNQFLESSPPRLTIQAQVTEDGGDLRLFIKPRAQRYDFDPEMVADHMPGSRLLLTTASYVEVTTWGGRIVVVKDRYAPETPYDRLESALTSPSPKMTMEQALAWAPNVDPEEWCRQYNEACALLAAK